MHRVRKVLLVSKVKLEIQVLAENRDPLDHKVQMEKLEKMVALEHRV